MLASLMRHETIVAFAVIGGAFSLLSWALVSRGQRGAVLARWCNGVGYAFMGASMLLFIVAGLFR